MECPNCKMEIYYDRKNDYNLNHDHVKYNTNEEHQLYMEGFRAGVTANKVKYEGVQHQEEKESLHEKRKEGPTIHQSCEDGDLDRVKEMVEYIPEIKNKLDEKGWAPIHICAALGHLDVLKWLLMNGVDLTEETCTGYCPIHLAAMRGHVNCIIVLVAMGCPISLQSVDKFTSLHLAAMRGQVECLKWLISNHAEIDIRDLNGRTPLDLAESYQHKECEDLLKKVKEELKRTDSVVSLLRNASNNARETGIVHVGGVNEISQNEKEMYKEEEGGWISESENNSAAIDRDGDDRSPSQRLVRYPDVEPTNNILAAATSKQEEREANQLEEKKRNYAAMTVELKRKNSSFLDSIRQDIEENNKNISLKSS